MTKRACWAVLLTAAFVPAAAVTQPIDRTVHLRAGESGVGTLRARGAGECFVITPRHVVQRAARMGEAIEVAGPAELRAEAELVTDRFSADLSILRLVNAPRRAACPAWPDIDGVNLALRRIQAGGGTGTITGWSDTGPATPLEARILGVDETRFEVHPIGGGKIRQGMSGSLVYADGRAVGILISDSTRDDSGNAVGIALRLDYVERHMEAFFHPMIPPSHARIMSSVAIPGLGQAATRRRGLAVLLFGAAAGGTAAAWTYPGTEEITLVGQTPTGEPYPYTREQRTHPYRPYAWVVWLLTGVVSAAEAYRYADRHYVAPPLSSARTSAARLRLFPDVHTTGGGVAVPVAGIRF